MKYGIIIDINRCTGCHACAVACMDQNDSNIEQGEYPWRTVHRIEKGTELYSEGCYISVACLHCRNAPCIAGCPSGAITKDEEGTVNVDESLCIGCHRCLMLCPFGIPRFSLTGKMQKCHLCRERLHAGLEPACVRTCPTRALQVEFGSDG